ncbi:MAG: four helix bundle protein [Nitrospiraceae bacterium]
MDKIRNFRDLEVWKLSKGIVLDVYQLTKGFPQEELYGLVSQMRRAAVSIAANIAEGFNRKHCRVSPVSVYRAWFLRRARDPY